MWIDKLNGAPLTDEYIASVIDNYKKLNKKKTKSNQEQMYSLLKTPCNKTTENSPLARKSQQNEFSAPLQTKQTPDERKTSIESVTAVTPGRTPSSSKKENILKTKCKSLEKMSAEKDKEINKIMKEVGDEPKKVLDF